jgi:hypothetical protein
MSDESKCNVPPAGWYCTREKGHDGPCAAHPANSIASNPFDDLVALHAQLLEENAYAYFELAYTRNTGWMAWICTNHRDEDPNRKVLACGQDLTPDGACRAALSFWKEQGNG